MTEGKMEQPETSTINANPVQALKFAGSTVESHLREELRIANANFEGMAAKAKAEIAALRGELEETKKERDQSKKLQELTLVNEIRWMRKSGAAESELARLREAMPDLTYMQLEDASRRLDPLMRDDRNDAEVKWAQQAVEAIRRMERLWAGWATKNERATTSGEPTK